MQRTLIVNALASEAPQRQITVCGWIRTRRDAKDFSFVEINDGSCLTNMQCIVDAGTAAHEGLGDANTGASVAVTGELVASPGKGQKWEVRAESIRVFGLADPESFPLQKKRHSDEFLRGIATCACAPTSTALPSASAPKRRVPCMTTSTASIFPGCIRPSSPAPTARARARCSA